MYCPKCGIAIGDIGNFCAKCGKNVTYLREQVAAELAAVSPEVDEFEQADDAPESGEQAIGEEGLEGEEQPKPLESQKVPERPKTPEPQPKTMAIFFCNYCGASVYGEDNFCYRCGKRVKKEFFRTKGKSKKKRYLIGVMVLVFIVAGVAAYLHFAGPAAHP
ncbi:MAG: hypothetical protein P4N59_22175 [Negativicutes bacterium]|nr:hypothetical protein [Negativicutes bacterium]